MDTVNENTPTMITTNPNPTEQVCTVQIACVVASDAEAMALKQAITHAVAGIAKKRVSFTLTDGTLPPMLPQR